MVTPSTPLPTLARATGRSRRAHRRCTRRRVPAEPDGRRPRSPGPGEEAGAGAHGRSGGRRPHGEGRLDRPDTGTHRLQGDLGRARRDRRRGRIRQRSPRDAAPCCGHRPALAGEDGLRRPRLPRRGLRHPPRPSPPAHCSARTATPHTCPTARTRSGLDPHARRPDIREGRTRPRRDDRRRIRGRPRPREPASARPVPRSRSRRRSSTRRDPADLEKAKVTVEVLDEDTLR